MGVPKFFRYISERYPCLSEVVKEHQVFDGGVRERETREKKKQCKSWGDEALLSSPYLVFFFFFITPDCIPSNVSIKKMYNFFDNLTQ